MRGLPGWYPNEILSNDPVPPITVIPKLGSSSDPLFCYVMSSTTLFFPPCILTDPLMSGAGVVLAFLSSPDLIVEIQFRGAAIWYPATWSFELLIPFSYFSDCF